MTVIDSPPRTARSAATTDRSVDRVFSTPNRSRWRVGDVPWVNAYRPSPNHWGQPRDAVPDPGTRGSTAGGRSMTTPDQVHRSVADRGDTLDHDEFRRGFSDAIDYLESLPGAWACHHASSTLEQPVSETGDISHLRGYRAALFRVPAGRSLGAVTADPHTVPRCGQSAGPAGLKSPGCRSRGPYCPIMSLSTASPTTHCPTPVPCHRSSRRSSTGHACPTATESRTRPSPGLGHGSGQTHRVEALLARFGTARRHPHTIPAGVCGWTTDSSTTGSDHCACPQSRGQPACTLTWKAAPTW